MLSDYHFFFIASSGGSPFHRVAWLSELSSLQAAAWGLRVSVSMEMLWCSLLPGALQRSAIPLARDRGKSFAEDPRMQTRFLHICVAVKRESGWGVVVGVQIPVGD